MLIICLGRYTDPVLGPRTIPDCRQPLAGLAAVGEGEAFQLDLQAATISLGGLVVSSLIYRVAE